MKDAGGTPKTVVVAGDFPAFTPEEMFRHWTDGSLLVQWWPEQAIVDPKVGGAYQLAWPDLKWRMDGVITRLEPPGRLAFRWMWDHDPVGAGPQMVDVRILPLEEGGCRVLIEHGPFEETPEGQQARQGVLEGWIHFGMRLLGLRPSENPEL